MFGSNKDSSHRGRIAIFSCIVNISRVLRRISHTQLHKELLAIQRTLHLVESSPKSDVFHLLQWHHEPWNECYYGPDWEWEDFVSTSSFYFCCFILYGIIHSRLQICHHLLTLMSFQCSSNFHLYSKSIETHRGE